MNRHTDLIGLFAVDHHRLDSFGDHRFRDVDATRAGHFYFLTTGDSHFVRELCRHFDEWLRHKLNIHRIVLGPIVIVLGETVSSADNVESFGRSAEFVQVRFELFCDRIV